MQLAEATEIVHATVYSPVKAAIFVAGQQLLGTYNTFETIAVIDEIARFHDEFIGQYCNTTVLTSTREFPVDCPTKKITRN
jgi:hypothetical protein